jgi:phage anti-repressor protein
MASVIQAFVSTSVQSILVTNRQIGDGSIQTVNARELHTFLEVGRDFSNRIKNRIEQYGFEESQDFVTQEVLSSPNLASSKSRPQKAVEYHISIDMAKELSMVERNEKGRQARQYFIECERRSNSMGDTPDLRFVLDNMDVLRNLLQQHKDRKSAYRPAPSYQPTQKALPGHGKSSAERKRDQRARDAEAALSGDPVSVSQCLKVLTEPRRNDLHQQKTRTNSRSLERVRNRVGRNRLRGWAV